MEMSGINREERQWGKKKKKNRSWTLARKRQDMKPWEEALTVGPQSLYILFLFLRKYLNTYLYLATSPYKELMSMRWSRKRIAVI